MQNILNPTPSNTDELEIETSYFAELLDMEGVDFPTYAKENDVSLSQLYDICREKSFLHTNHQPYQNLIDDGYFFLLETSYTNPETMDRIKIIKTIITKKGEILLNLNTPECAKNNSTL